MEESAGEWGGSVEDSEIGLAVAYQLLLMASDLFVEEGGTLHEGYCLRRGDV